MYLIVSAHVMHIHNTTLTIASNPEIYIDSLHYYYVLPLSIPSYFKGSQIWENKIFFRQEQNENFNIKEVSKIAQQY